MIKETKIGLKMLLSLVWIKIHGPQNLKYRVILLILPVLLNILVPKPTAAKKAQKIWISMPQYKEPFFIPGISTKKQYLMVQDKETNMKNYDIFYFISVPQILSFDFF